MSAIEVVVRPRSQAPQPENPSALRGLFDILVDGLSLSTRLGEGQSLTLLCDLAQAVSGLGRGKKSRATLPIYTEDEAWELGLESDATEVLLSVYRVGPRPEVLLHERRLDAAVLRTTLLRAMDEAIAQSANRTATAALSGARSLLTGLIGHSERRAAPRRLCRVEPKAVGTLAFSAEAPFRLGETQDGGALAASPHVERADLHALLVRGSAFATARGRTLTIEGVYPFLIAEQLLALAEDVLEAWQAERSLVRLVTVDGARLGVQRSGAGGLTLTFRPVQGARAAGGVALPELTPQRFIKAAVRFARALAEQFISLDPIQSQNLRLLSLVREAGELETAARDAALDDSLTNPEPEAYKTFGLPRPPAERRLWANGGKMRFLPRWAATVPGLDLRATFHCGSRIVVGGQRETACLESQSGRVLWRIPGSRAACVATPVGIARVHQDGLVELFDLDRGEMRVATRLRPRATSGAAGALVNAPGLPRLLVLAEGDRSVTALDLVSGEVRWRFSARRPTQYRLRRAGRLLLAAGGDTALIALDVVTGEVVWRVRDRRAFTGELCVDKDSAFALVGGPIGSCKLLHVDLWSGAVRFERELEDRPLAGQAPLITANRVMLPIRDRRGLGVVALERESGVPCWRQEPGFTSGTTSFLAVDDLLVANTASGAFLALEAETGHLRYNHVFSRNVDSDQPRRLEPVLRNGALFVPQHRVHVVRPRDGEVIGCVPSDLIPDLLRVDECCTVFIAEESGHLAAFGVAPKLELVR
ncbi:MAG TPA: PQQ-binding-like beta-propeller repeat protein [Polyangiaceae bacterium]|nr:PQQ-binding-like beta-propeller repeat protein [Polyangiaceae bacterium]